MNFVYFKKVKIRYSMDITNTKDITNLSEHEQCYILTCVQNNTS